MQMGSVETWEKPAEGLAYFSRRLRLCDDCPAVSLHLSILMA